MISRILRIIHLWIVTDDAVAHRGTVLLISWIIEVPIVAKWHLAYLLFREVNNARITYLNPNIDDQVQHETNSKWSKSHNEKQSLFSQKNEIVLPNKRLGLNEKGLELALVFIHVYFRCEFEWDVFRISFLWYQSFFLLFWSNHRLIQLNFWIFSLLSFLAPIHCI